MPENLMDSFDEMPLNRQHLKITFISVMGAFLDGYDNFIISAVLLFLVPQFQLNKTQVGLLGSVAFFGALIGAYTFGYIADRVGRRTVFLWDLVVFAAIALLQGVCQNVTQLMILRFILGLAIGADLPISAAIIAEFSPRKYRGRLTSLMIVFLFLGGVAANLVGVGLYQLMGEKSWHWMFFSGIVPAIIVLIFRQSIPESPRWLLAKGRVEEAKQAMASVGNNLSSSDIASLSQRPANQSNEAIKYKKIFERPYLRFTLLLAIMWFLLNSMSSSFSVYNATILKTFSGISILRSLEFSALSFSASMIITLISSLFIDRLGRRKIMYILMAITLLGAVILLAQNGKAPNPTFVILGVILASCSLGASGIVFMNLSAELFPTSIRATAEGFAVGSNKVGAYVGTLVVPTILFSFGIRGMMFVVMVVAIISIILTVLLKVEPAQRSLEDAG